MTYYTQLIQGQFWNAGFRPISGGDYSIPQPGVPAVLPTPPDRITSISIPGLSPVGGAFIFTGPPNFGGNSLPALLIRGESQSYSGQEGINVLGTFPGFGQLVLSINADATGSNVFPQSSGGVKGSVTREVGFQLDSNTPLPQAASDCQLYLGPQDVTGSRTIITVATENDPVDVAIIAAVQPAPFAALQSFAVFSSGVAQLGSAFVATPTMKEFAPGWVGIQVVLSAQFNSKFANVIVRAVDVPT